MTRGRPPCWRLATPAAAGPLAVVEVHGPPAGLGAALARMGIAPVAAHGVGLRDIPGVDRAVVMRPAPGVVLLMPHGGPAVIAAVLSALTAAGIPEDRDPDARDAFPEAHDRLEAEMLRALARAPSPRAVDLLLDQPRRWRAARPGLTDLPAGNAGPLDRTLARLIHPPLVAALGGANIGKSTLCNALARRPVAVVADEPGTTRDHVGVQLEVDGLVIRYADTPGVRADAGPLEQEAHRLAEAVWASADLILLCGDPGTPPPPVLVGLTPPAGVLRLALRADLGAAAWPHDLAVSAASGAGVEALAREVRRRLIPDAALADPGLWRFWDA